MLGMHSVAHPLVCFESLILSYLWFSIFGRLELSFDYSNLSFLYSVFKVPDFASLLYYLRSFALSYIYNVVSNDCILKESGIHLLSHTVSSIVPSAA